MALTLSNRSLRSILLSHYLLFIAYRIHETSSKIHVEITFVTRALGIYTWELYIEMFSQCELWRLGLCGHF